MHPSIIHALQGPPLDPFNWYNLIGGLGCLAWLVAYALVILQGSRQKTYGIPMIAVCLNFTWEFLASFVLDRQSGVKVVGVWLFFDRSWILVDAFIVWQLLRYGRAQQQIPEVKRFFYPIVAAVMLIAFGAQLAFTHTYMDPYGIIDAYVINLVMSILFIVRYFERRDSSGLAYAVAWTKGIATALTSIECFFLLPAIHPSMACHWFPRYLTVAVFFFDCVYVGLLWDARRTAKAKRLAEAPTSVPYPASAASSSN